MRDTSSKKIKTVIIEDDALLAFVNQKHIEYLGHEVVGIITNGTDAVEFVKENKTDIIIMDIKIDGVMDGIQTMTEIRKFSDTAVIFISGNSEVNTKNKAGVINNCLGFLVKPINQYELKIILNKFTALGDNE